MKFTYAAYDRMAMALREQGYAFCGYHDYREYNKCVILRHDVDYDLEKAAAFARFEKRIGVTSTYFVLLSGNFYNLYSKKNADLLKEIAACGHSIGLHYDEETYPERDMPGMSRQIEKEAKLLGEHVGRRVETVSMHRPSKRILEGDLELDGLINSYGKEFFEQFKYLSDSRMHWREDVMEWIEKGEEARLHILTHPFWYREEERKTGSILYEFIESAKMERYRELDNNFRDLDEYLEICGGEVWKKGNG